MKQKVFYVAFVFAVIFLLIFINRKSNINQPVPTPKIIQQFSTEQEETLAKQSQSSLLSENKPAVTFIKKAKSTKQIAPLEGNKNINTSVRPKTISASSGSVATASSPAGTQAAVKEPAAGVTKVGKRPSMERIEELRVQGILMH